ncbi:MAG TPA: hypothetical protein ENI76_02175 [Ignavibacteria bacterium]|nr:hypothetical protein [Ignavibacteria bacterium]
MNKKDIAKFLAGAFAWETMVHVTIEANNLAPITIFGFTITPQLNTPLIIFPAITTAILVYYAWFKK